MADLSSSGNVYSSCLLLLRQRGYDLWRDVERDDEGYALRDEDGRLLDGTDWMAEKNGVSFHADNPIELLGLTAIYEYKGEPREPEPYWWGIEGDDIERELIHEMNSHIEDEAKGAS